MLVIFDKERPRGSIRSQLLRFALFFALVGMFSGALVGVVAYGYFGQGLPEFDSIDDYRPKTVTRVYGQEGQLIGEFYREKRIVLPYDRIPPKVVQAFMAPRTTASSTTAASITGAFSERPSPTSGRAGSCRVVRRSPSRSPSRSSFGRGL